MALGLYEKVRETLAEPIPDEVVAEVTASPALKLVFGYAGWRYSFGHSPRSFSAAVTSNPAAGVIANPGGFGFFL